MLCEEPRQLSLGILSTLGMGDVPSLEMRHPGQVIPGIGILAREWDTCVGGQFKRIGLRMREKQLLVFGAQVQKM